MSPGASFEGGAPCVHCAGVSRADAHPRLRWVCSVCGGPLVPGVGRAELGEEGVASLARARREDVAAVVGSASAVVAAIVTVVAGAGALAAWALGARVVAAVIGAASIVALVQSFVFRGARASHERESTRALDQGWAAGARAIAREHGGTITSRELATVTKVNEAIAERVLSTMSAQGARVEVVGDADLRYRLEVTESVAPSPRVHETTERP